MNRSGDPRCRPLECPSRTGQQIALCRAVRRPTHWLSVAYLASRADGDVESERVTKDRGLHVLTQAYRLGCHRDAQSPEQEGQKLRDPSRQRVRRARVLEDRSHRQWSQYLRSVEARRFAARYLGLTVAWLVRAAMTR